MICYKIHNKCPFLFYCVFTDWRIQTIKLLSVPIIFLYLCIVFPPYYDKATKMNETSSHPTQQLRHVKIDSPSPFRRCSSTINSFPNYFYSFPRYVDGPFTLKVGLSQSFTKRTPSSYRPTSRLSFQVVDYYLSVF